MVACANGMPTTRSTCSAMARSPVVKEASPCRKALRLARALPAPVRGPRLYKRSQFFRLAAACFAEVRRHHRQYR